MSFKCFTQVDFPSNLVNRLVPSQARRDRPRYSGIQEGCTEEQRQRPLRPGFSIGPQSDPADAGCAAEGG